MIAEILSTGDEIRTGSIVDTNSAYIAQELETSGLEVCRHTCVGDDTGALVSILREISNRSDVGVVTGGLGPTHDDLSAAAAARAAGVELVLYKQALLAVENFFKARNRLMPPSNRKQAMLPKDAECLLNPMGTAPGFVLKINRCVLFFLPGVPAEMRRFMTDEVLPRIEILQGKKRAVSLINTLSVFGITEAETGERVKDLPNEFPNIRVGLRADFPVIQVKLYARGGDEKAIRRELIGASKWAAKKLGNKVFSKDGNRMEVEIGGLLRQRNATIAIAESCTGGLISDWITNVPGSSDYLLFSGVTYSNDAKIKILGVSEQTILKHGAVHEETAKEMAEGIRRISGATYGISTSGIAGPDGGTPEKPVGTVCVGLAAPESSQGRRYQFHYQERLRNKTIFAMAALDLLRREMLKS
jgi:nicotinamide-nucleotide amidase